VPKDVPKDVPKERLKNEIEIFRENPHISMKEIAGRLNVSIKTVKRDIEQLKKSGRLARIGGRKTGYWKIYDISVKNKVN
ncbi:MAG: AAA family ATPase, partial [Candidatus Cloacimonadota bacterium]